MMLGRIGPSAWAHEEVSSQKSHVTASVCPSSQLDRVLPSCDVPFFCVVFPCKIGAVVIMFDEDRFLDWSRETLRRRCWAEPPPLLAFVSPRTFKAPPLLLLKPFSQGGPWGAMSKTLRAGAEGASLKWRAWSVKEEGLQRGDSEGEALSETP